MPFILPDSEPKKSAYPEGSLQLLLHENIATNLNAIRAISDPRIEEFFEILEVLDFSDLDQDRMERLIIDGEQAFMLETRDAHFQERRRQLCVANRITVADQDSPTGLSTYAIDTQDRIKFMELLEKVAETPVKAIHPEPILPAAEIVEDTLVKVIHDDTISCHRLLGNYFKTSIIDPITGARVLTYNPGNRLPSDLDASLKRLAKINKLLQECLRDPYKFAIEYGIKRDQDVAHQVKSGLDEILHEANADLLKKMNEFKAASKRAAKLGSSVIDQSVVNKTDDGLTPRSTIDTLKDRSPSEFTGEINPDHIVEVSELGVHSVLSPLHGKGMQYAEVTKLNLRGNTVLIVYAYDPSLMINSSTSRVKYDRASGKAHPYDMALKSVAERLANGEAPDALGSKTLKYVNKNRRSEAYYGLLLAGVKVRSSNDSNVYITFSSTEELDLNITEIGDAPCIVVLAETDKTNQLYALQLIRGVQAASIRNRRSGIK